MVGPSVTPYLVPVAAMVPIAFWLAMVFWASSHPVRGGSSGAEQYPGVEPPQDARVEMGVPEQRRPVEHAGADARAGAVPSQAAPDRVPERRAAAGRGNG